MAKAAPPRRRPRLAPLEPEAFLAWVWRMGPRDRGTSPLTLDDVWFEIGPRSPDLTLERLRRDYVHLAARVRRNQRLGLEPLHGISG